MSQFDHHMLRLYNYTVLHLGGTIKEIIISLYVFFTFMFCTHNIYGKVH